MAKNKYFALFKQKVIADFSNGVQEHELSVKYNVEKLVINRWISRYKGEALSKQSTTEIVPEKHQKLLIVG